MPYTKQDIPKQSLFSTFCAISNTINAKYCSEYSIMTPLSQALKQLLKQIHRPEDKSDDSQFNFGNEFGISKKIDT